MIQINLKNGITVKFDLSTELGQMGWHEFCADPSVPTLISGIGVLKDKQTYVTPIPKFADLVGIGGGLLSDPKQDRIAGEFVWYKTNNIRVIQTVYTGNHKIAKTEVEEL